MAEIVRALTHMIYPAIVLITGAIGVYLLVMQNESLREKYDRLFYAITQQHPEDYSSSYYRVAQITTRFVGIAFLLVSLLFAYLTYLKYASD
ncbi:MAG: hypothetical protein AAGA45_03005 [Verrucomicrobiota bacterium]